VDVHALTGDRSPIVESEATGMRRSLKLALIIGVCLLVLGIALLWALPEILRRVAQDQITKRTGRLAVIEDVDLNLFTGHLAMKKFRLAEREGPEPFVEFERFEVRLAPMALLRSHVLVRELTLATPTIRIVRTGPGEFNFSDLLTGTGAPAPAPTPSRFTVTVERLSLSRGRITVGDRAVSPPTDWLVQDLDVDVKSLSTQAGAAPGQLSLRAKVNEAVLVANADALRIEPHQLHATLSLDGFETRRLTPYVYGPLGTPYRPKGGRFAVRLTSTVDSDAQEVRKAVLSGTMSLEGEAFAKVGRQDPFVSATRVGVEIKEADLLSRTLTIRQVALEGLDLKVRRDVQGVIDVLEMFTPKASPAATAASAPPPVKPASPPAPGERRTLFPVIRALGRGFEQILVERIALAPSTALFVDEGVKPTTTLALAKLQATVNDFTWPVTKPATIAVSTGLPGGGTLNVKGPLTVQPFDAELTIAIRDAPVGPYQAYIPVPARLSGRYNGDSKNRIALRNGTLVAQSKGNSWAQNVEIREPGATRPAIRVERMELMGIDFDWPRRATAVTAGFQRLRVEVEREADGSFNLRRLFTPPGEAPPAPEPAPYTGPPPKGLLETMRLEFGDVRVKDGFIRFLDRTTQPAFSQDLSRIELTVTGLGNQPGRRAKVTLQSVVGGDAGLDIRGELNALGAPTFIDLVGELRSFKLPSVDPYVTSNIGWVIKKGELQYKVRFKLEGDQLSADNDLVVGQLQVAPASGSDEVKRRLGLPLGLIVALIKDQKGDIRVNVPVAGTVNDPQFKLGDAIWTAVKNVLVNVVTAPFKAIGRLFSRDGGDKVEVPKVEEPKVEPVTFAAGSSVLSPGMEDHLLRVAEVLRRSPFVNLALTAVVTPADADALRSEAVAARLRDFQKEHGLDDPSAALAEYYKARLPDVFLPATVEEQMTLLREREPAPDALLADLRRRRVEATRERLVTAEGIPAARLTGGEEIPAAAGPASAAPPPEAAAEGRVEFAIVAGE
jgi:hypothetical protein